MSRKRSEKKSLFSMHYEDRILFLIAMIFFAFCVILLRGFYLQFVEYDALTEMSENKNYQLRNLNVHRGKIMDREGNLLAASLPSPSVYALKNKLNEGQRPLENLSGILGVPVSEIRAKLEKARNFTWIAHNIGGAKAEKLEEIKLDGVYTAPDFARYYPSVFHAAQVVGFTGRFSKGWEGIEHKYDDELMGRGERFSGALDSVYQNSLKTAQGLNLRLTLNEQIQYQTEKHLSEAVSAMKAISGVAIVMETRTGEILAMASIPDYDPNRYQDFRKKDYYNRAVGDSYEPGSIFKLITIAIARQHGYISEDDEFYCENGYYQVLDHIIRDSTGKFGILPISEIVKKSSNIGAIKIGQTIPTQEFHEEILNFGFNRKTDVGMPGEQLGVVHPHEKWSKSDQATISYGHSLLVTPIQMISAINAIANRGLYVKPHIISSFADDNGEVVFSREIQSRKVLDEDVAREITGYMKGVVEKGGTGYKARLEKIAVAGKTGTTRKYDNRTGKYSTENHIVSFAGFLPADNPRLTVLAIINEPQENYRGSKSAAPVFREIAKSALDRFSPVNIQTSVFRTNENPDSPGLFSRPDSAKPEDETWKGLFLRQVLGKAVQSGKTLEVAGNGRVRKSRAKRDGSGLTLSLD